MLLAIDIGNTNTVVGVFDRDKLVESRRLVSSHTRTTDEYWIMIKLLCLDCEINIHNFQGVIIGSVVPELTHSFIEMSKKYLSIEPIIVNHTINLGLKVLVTEPGEVGADRLCNAVAGKKYYPHPLVIVDLGTATTFDVLNKNGDYIGGAIAPGLITASLELTKRAAKLHKVEMKFPERIIGKTTSEHMQSGIFVGHIAMIEGIIERIKKELDCDKLHVVATGGIAEEIAKHTLIINEANPLLTLEGLRLIYFRNS